MVRPGDIAPEFEATDCFGKRLRLTDFRGKKWVVLFFFPKAFTPGCTMQVRNFRDNYERLAVLNTVLIGVSTDAPEKSCRFAQVESLQFPLIGDESRAISMQYGVVWPFLKLNRRVTFLIHKDGIVEDVLHHEIQVRKHIEAILSRLSHGVMS